MKKQVKKHIPPGIMEFVRENFTDACTTEINKISRKNGSCIYRVEVSDNDFLHHLKFSEKGKLLEREMEPAHPVDPYLDEEYWEENI